MRAIRAGLMAAACAGVMFGVTLTDRLTADVQADVTYATVSIESGAQIEGNFSKLKG